MTAQQQPASTPAAPSLGQRRDLRREVLALAEFLDPALSLELNLTYQALDALGAEHDQTVAELRDTRRRLHDSQVYAGHLADHVGQLKARLADLSPEEIIKARREAHLTGDAYIRVRSLGAMRYATDYLPGARVVARDE